MNAKPVMIAVLVISSLVMFSVAGMAQQKQEAKDIHGRLGVSCPDCHGAKGPPQVPDRETCLKCHKSYAAVAERTEKLKPNPHASHDGWVACTHCHATHGTSRLYCNGCHNFTNFKMK
jgi:fumarate reductase flavoprotein subunit